jgi:hypothetical protein
MPSLTDVNGFKNWLVAASPGASIVYYRGALVRERVAHRDCSLHALAAFVYGFGCSPDVNGKRASCAVSLVQRRIDDGRYDYVAVRTAHPLPHPAKAEAA